MEPFNWNAGIPAAYLEAEDLKLLSRLLISFHDSVDRDDLKIRLRDLDDRLTCLRMEAELLPDLRVQIPIPHVMRSAEVRIEIKELLPHS